MANLREFFGLFTNLFRWWFIVAPWEQAVRVRLGKHTALLGSGVHLRIPFADRVYIHTTRKRLVYMPAQTLTTKDYKHVTIAGSLGYTIRDLLKMYNSLHQPKDTIVQELMGRVSHYIVTHNLDACSPAEIEKYVNAGDSIASYGLDSHGFIVIDFAVVRTYRLLNGEITRWEQSALEVNVEAFRSGGGEPG